MSSGLVGLVERRCGFSKPMSFSTSRIELLEGELLLLRPRLLRLLGILFSASLLALVGAGTVTGRFLSAALNSPSLNLAAFPPRRPNGHISTTCCCDAPARSRVGAGAECYRYLLHKRAGCMVVVVCGGGVGVLWESVESGRAMRNVSDGGLLLR